MQPNQIGKVILVINMLTKRKEKKRKEKILQSRLKSDNFFLGLDTLPRVA